MYFRVSIAVFLLISTVHAFCGSKDASIERYPYQVLFFRAENDYCNGAILSDRWIITTYDFCAKFFTKNWKVRAGSSTRTENGSLHDIEEVIKHNDYNPRFGNPTNDIALVKVKQPFIFDETRRAIELFNATEELIAGTMVNVSGFGFVANGTDPTYPVNLQSIQVSIMDLELCKELFPGGGARFEGLVCAGYGGHIFGVGFYFNDVGDPLVIDGRLAALVSWPFSCSQGRPSLCTEIAHYRDWIDEYAFGIKVYQGLSGANISGGQTVFYLLLTVYLLIK